MGDGIYTALTGAIAQQHALDTVANNVANANTIGFRGDRAVFGEMVRAANNTRMETARTQKEDRFTQVPVVMRDVSDGATRQTGNRLDFALHGDGFFVVRTQKSGDVLTRAGSFMTQADGTLTTPDGSQVLGDDGKIIKLPPGVADIQVDGRGILSASGTPFAKFLLGKVADPQSLQKAGNAYLSAPADGKLVKATQVEVQQGYVEMSNVNAIAGLNELISVNRSFDALQKAIETFEKLDERCARELGSRTG